MIIKKTQKGLPILASGITECVSVSSFASVAGILLEITNL